MEVWDGNGAQMLRDLAARGSAYGTGEQLYIDIICCLLLFMYAYIYINIIIYM